MYRFSTLFHTTGRRKEVETPFYVIKRKLVTYESDWDCTAD